MVADELFEGRHLAGDRIDAADHKDVRHIDELPLAPEMPRRVRTERREGVFAIDAPVAQEERPTLADRQRPPLLGVDQYDTDARVSYESRDESGERGVE